MLFRSLMPPVVGGVVHMEAMAHGFGGKAWVDQVPDRPYGPGRPAVVELLALVPGLQRSPSRLRDWPGFCTVVLRQTFCQLWCRTIPATAGCPQGAHPANCSSGQGFQRRGWDSNPRKLSLRWFSRPEPSTTRPPFQVTSILYRRSVDLSTLFLFRYHSVSKIGRAHV